MKRAHAKTKDMKVRRRNHRHVHHQLERGTEKGKKVKTFSACQYCQQF